jgi:2-keto-4-pentenoate hydratase/2-oxohepta-3-ene-1,7-dioic acid hydratase in catechol pathway/pimeloyl-ACP methyl ester carboxylesterase
VAVRYKFDRRRSSPPFVARSSPLFAARFDPAVGASSDNDVRRSATDGRTVGVVVLRINPMLAHASLDIYWQSVPLNFRALVCVVCVFSFIQSPQSSAIMSTAPTHFVAYKEPGSNASRIGSLEGDAIRPLSFASGTPLENLYQVIEVGASQVLPSPTPIPLSSVQLLPPISGRDVLCVGKNYMDHAKEFNSSGFDSSDKIDRPSHPVIFTKRATSIIAHEEEIFLHKDFTETIDYEGEIGVIIGRPGFRIRQEDAWDHVWGFTIINDVTARERQRDHKQFYIGKSADTFCPMGPVAVPKETLPKTLVIKTTVNSELRQHSDSDNLIFPIAELIKTMSEGQTLQSGDVLATGTPAGVGIGRSPPIYLAPGDEVSVSIDGIGTLKNKIASASSDNVTVGRVASQTAIHATNTSKVPKGRAGLTSINSKPLHYTKIGSGPRAIVFVHGLGGTQEHFQPLISALKLEEGSTLHLFDFEGHGLSPTHPLSTLTIASLAADLAGVFQHAGITAQRPAVLVAHSMGCLVALHFALHHPGLAGKLLLLGPPPSPLPKAGSRGSLARAALVREQGMAVVVDAVVAAGTSAHTRAANPVAVAAVRLSLLGQDPEAYAKACTALAASHKDALAVEELRAEVLMVTGDEDAVSPPALCKKYAARIKGSSYVSLPNVGHWHVFENVEAVAPNVKSFLQG